jgi:hypothetical protein
VAYISIDDFRVGMDRRRKRVAGQPGSLWTLKDGHLTRGADIERRKRFVSRYTLPAGSRGLASIRSQLYTFGSADLAGDTPLGVTYQRLQAPSAPVLTKILDVKSFQGLLYVIAEYDDGSIYHFYNGTRVSDWDAAVSSTAITVAQRLAAKLAVESAVIADAFGAVLTITARVPGTAFTISGGVVDGGADNTQALNIVNQQANVAGVAEVLATATVEVTAGVNDPGTDTINSLLINGEEILDNILDWSGSNEATAIRLSTSINNGTALHGYSAGVVGAVVTVTAAPGTGTAPNGYVVAVSTTGTVTATADAEMAGGVAAVAAVAQVEAVTISGVIEIEDTFSVTINGTAYPVTGLSSVMGTSLYVDKQRVWSPAGGLWRYCMLGTATVWDPDNIIANNDAGFIDITEETEGTDNLVVATRYQNFAAVISQGFISLWSLDTNPANFAIADTLDNTGTDAHAAVVRFGNNDTFYLDSTGIRSLRARDASNAPFVSDVGNAVDTFVSEVLDALTPQQRLDAVGAIEPRDGRFWLAAGGTIFVLSYFPSDEISAWSYYQPDEFNDESVEAIVRVRKQIFVRAGDTAFLYGGVGNDEYPAADESVCVAELPFLSAKDPATFKEFKGFDIACTNEWEVEVLYDPNDEARTINIGRVTKTTFNELDVKLSGQTTMVALKLTCREAGAASISSLQIHFNKLPE